MDRYWVRFAIPQAVTATRGVLGAWALFLGINGDLDRAALLLTAGVITDRLDGLLAKGLRVASDFGSRFDCFVDYLFYIVVPSVLAFRLCDSPDGVMMPVLALPFVAGAIRYSRNIGIGTIECFEESGFPGLPTLIFAFYVVGLVYLAREGGLPASIRVPLMATTVPVFSALMVTRIRYPKLAANPWLLAAMVTGINLMPFAFTRQLASATLLLGSLYVVLPMIGAIRKELRCLYASRS